MTQKPDLEKILETIIAVAEGLDKSSAEKLREIAQDVLKSKDPNQLSMLENAVLSLFNKVRAEFPDLEEEEGGESVDKRKIEIDSLILRYQGWHDNLIAVGSECCLQIINAYRHVIAQELTHLNVKKAYFCETKDIFGGTNTLKPHEFTKFIAKAKKKYSELEARYTRNQFSTNHQYDEAMLKYHIFPLEITEDMKKEQKQ